MLTVRLKKGYEKTILKGFPWVYAGNLVMSSEHLLAAPGELAELRSVRDAFLGIGTFNAAAPIAFRMLSTRHEPIDAQFFRRRLEATLKKREAKFREPYYRLAHAESDGLPGVILDRFGQAIVMQISTAGMERLLPHLLEALESVAPPHTLILRNDIPAREHEGLARGVKILKGTLPQSTELYENGCTYLADLLRGQKTGWFYDQRDNRKLAAQHALNKTVLDVYSHSGGFGLLAAKAGAAQVTLVDSSAPALTLAAEAAKLNGVFDRCAFLQGDAFDTMQELARAKRLFDVVITDPPAFVKSRDHINNGMKGYEKVACMAAALTAPGGMLAVASCSHHATRTRFLQAVQSGIARAGRSGEILHFTRHAADHPPHPHLPQSEYLKALFLRIG